MVWNHASKWFLVCFVCLGGRGAQQQCSGVILALRSVIIPGSTQKNLKDVRIKSRSTTCKARALLNSFIVPNSHLGF